MLLNQKQALVLLNSRGIKIGLPGLRRRRERHPDNPRFVRVGGKPMYDPAELERYSSGIPQ